MTQRDQEPDSPALRARRARRHKAGDHSLCSPERCAARRGSAAAPPEPVQGGSAGGVTGAVTEMLAAAKPDQRGVLAQVALRLAGEIDAVGPDAAIVRELRQVLGQLCGAAPGRADDWVDDLARKRQDRRRKLFADG